MKKYSKALVAASGVLVALGEAGRDGSIDQGEAFTIMSAIAVAVGVWAARNEVA